MALASTLIGGWHSRIHAKALEPRYRSVRIDGVPHVRQKPDFCGEACAEMFLRKLGTRLTQDDVFDASGLNPELGRGCYTRDLVAALTRLGFQDPQAWSYVDARRADRGLEAQFRQLHSDLCRGVPSIVCMRYDERPEASEHFRLVVGFDAKSDELLYHEPAELNGAYRRMPRTRLLDLWPLKYRHDRWTVVRLPLKPENLRATPATTERTDADYAQHVMQLKRRLPSDVFTIVVQKPFVVIGDEPAEVVRRRTVQTVKWSVDRLKQDYFSQDPRDIIDIWLFKDKASYETNTRRFFADSPGTPYGYYSSVHKALIMNIATGGGTLVHEIVHPFMEANFPNCPSWFNEGLASLYEQCGDRDGHIHGYTNWRLNGLQRAIRANSVPSFRTLCGTTRREFYHSDPGTNYSQARYLCYYLQERGLLVDYFHEFRRTAGGDPTGYAALQRVLGDMDMVAFQKQWEQFVLKLRRD